MDCGMASVNLHGECRRIPSEREKVLEGGPRFVMPNLGGIDETQKAVVIVLELGFHFRDEYFSRLRWR